MKYLMIEIKIFIPFITRTNLLINNQITFRNLIILDILLKKQASFN